MRDRHALLHRKITVFGSTYRLEETLWSYILLMPSILVFSVFTFMPVIYSAWLSLHRWNLMDPTTAFVGISNYISTLGSPDFRQAFWNTLYYSLGTIPAGTVLALVIAILLNQKIGGLSFYRTVYFLPVVTSMVAVSAVWMWIYHPTYGPLNSLLDVLGLAPQKWLRDPKLAMACIIAMSIWKGLGYNIVIFLAGLQNIPAHLYEAAQVDGAGKWDCFRYVTLPMLSPTVLFILIMAVIGSFQVFTQVHVMTQGGPLGSTTVLVYYLYQKAFQRLEMGYASATAYILFICIFCLTIAQLKLSRKRVHYL